MLIFTPNLAYSSSDARSSCSRSLADVLQHIPEAQLKLLYSDSLIKPWMQVLNSNLKSHWDANSLGKIIQPYGLKLTSGPNDTLLITRKNESADATTLVTGKIIDKESEKAIEFAKIRLNTLEQNTEADNNGCFLLAGLPQGDYKLSVHSILPYAEIEKKLHIDIFNHPHILIELEIPKTNALQELYIYGMPPSPLELKRQTSGIVENLSSSQIQNNPDTNPSESLERISGISTTRQNGEGRFISVRGFGGDYNMVTLNGRTMPSSSLLFNGGGNSSSRAFDLSNIATESISNIEVYKTSRASIATGGIGATVNITTPKPLDDPTAKASFVVKAINDTSNRIGNNVTPGTFGFMNITDPHGKFGAYIGGSFQQRNNASTGAYVSNWYSQQYDGTVPLSPTSPQSGEPIRITNPLQQGDIYSLPIDFRYTHADRESTRTNIQSTFQFKPNENITSTLDYLYTKHELYENRSEFSVWMDSYRSDLVFDDEAIATPVLYWEERRENSPRDIGLAIQQLNVKNENSSVALNLQYEASANLSLSFDAHKSKAISVPNQAFGNWVNVGMGVNASGGQGVDFTHPLPVLMLDFNDSELSKSNGLLDKSEIGSSVRQIFNDRVKAEVSEIQLEGNLILDSNNSISFGFEQRWMKNHSQSSYSIDSFAGNWNIGTPGDVPEEYLQVINYQKLFSSYHNSSHEEFFDNASDGAAKPVTEGVIGDAAVIGQYLSAAVDLPWAPNPIDNADRLIEEETQAGYIQLQATVDIGGTAVNVLSGLRYETTFVESKSFTHIPSKIVWQGDNDFLIQSSDQQQATSKTNKYEYLLPSIDFDFEPISDIKMRFSYSKTIARANYRELTSTVDYVTVNQYAFSLSGYASTGNPGLLPLESDNFDVSTEWYYDKNSYVSLGYFEKRVQNFILIGMQEETLFGLTNPYEGPRVIAAVNRLENEGEPITIEAVYNAVLADQQQSDGSLAGNDVAGNSDDPLLNFYIDIPVNAASAKFSGFELFIQHNFFDSGFGIQGNYSAIQVTDYLERSKGYLSSVTGFPNLNDSANVAIFYSKNKLSSYITYNWTDGYTNPSRINVSGTTSTEAYNQIDFKFSYNLNPLFTVSFEGLNITKQYVREHVYTEAQINRIELLGARYILSARYNL